MAAEGGFLGVPLDGFAEAGLLQLEWLRGLGLRRQSRVLDIGCGCLRAGYWLVHHLIPNRYFGIEPRRQRVELGLRHLLEPEVARAKQPRFDHGAEFDTAVFAQRFDFFLAGSVWSHAAKAQIERMLDGFLRDARPGAAFVASYVPAIAGGADDYLGDRWVGTSHESDTSGCVGHSLAWIRQACAQRGLTVEPLGARDCGGFGGQEWVVVRRARQH
jgi:hypothetical protein